MLYRRGRPTSIELLLLMVIPKLSLPLSCHSPLGLHHLLRLVGAARGLVALRRVEVLQVGRRVRTARITEVADRVRARSGAAPDATDVYVFPSVDDQIKPSGPPALRPARSIPQLRGRLAGSAEGRNELTSGSRRAKHLAALDKIVDGSINLWKNQISSPFFVQMSLLVQRRPWGGRRVQPGRRSAEKGLLPSSERLDSVVRERDETYPQVDRQKRWAHREEPWSWRLGFHGSS